MRFGSSSLYARAASSPAAARRSRLRQRDTAAFAPLITPASGWPALLDGVHAPRETLDTALERLIGTPGTALLEALDADPDVRPTTAWDAVRREPDRWLRHYVDALRRAWPGVEPLWRRSGALLEREQERFGASVERGVPASQLINQLSPRTSLVDGCLRLTPAEHAPPPASLEALLGPQRTRILERLDDRQAAGELADVLHLAPSAITFHVRSLEAAGLVIRVRDGRNVMVHRTSRGTQLLALYQRP